MFKLKNTYRNASHILCMLLETGVPLGHRQSRIKIIILKCYRLCSPTALLYINIYLSVLWCRKTTATVAAILLLGGDETIRRLFGLSLPDAAVEPLSTYIVWDTRARATNATHRRRAHASSLARLAAPFATAIQLVGPRRRSFTAAATVQSIPPPVVSSSTPPSLYGMGPRARA